MIHSSDRYVRYAQNTWVNDAEEVSIILTTISSSSSCGNDESIGDRDSSVRKSKKLENDSSPLQYNQGDEM